MRASSISNLLPLMAFIIITWGGASLAFPITRELLVLAEAEVPSSHTAGRTSSPSAQQLVLYGVIIVDGKKTALLQDVSQTHPRNIHEGESFAGGVITAIRSNGVTFRYAEQDLNIPLGAGRTATTGGPGEMGLPGGPPMMSVGRFEPQWQGGPSESVGREERLPHLPPWEGRPLSPPPDQGRSSLVGEPPPSPFPEIEPESETISDASAEPEILEEEPSSQNTR